MANPKIVNVLIFGAITVLLCFATVKAFTSTVASLKYYSVKQFTDSWNNGEQPSVKQYKTAVTMANDAVSYQPSMAFYSDVLAEVLQWGLYFGYESDPEATQHNVLDLYTNSIAMRPSWPVTWGSQTYIKSQLQYANDEITYDLNRADTLGASTPEIHILMTKLGYQLLKSNLSLYLEFNEAISQRFELGLLNRLSTRAVLKVVDDYNGTSVGCLWLNKAEATDRAYRILKCKR